MDVTYDGLEEDELEPVIEDNGDEVGLNRFEIEDLDDHGRKWQAYLAGKEALQFLILLLTRLVNCEWIRGIGFDQLGGTIQIASQHKGVDHLAGGVTTISIGW